LQIKHPGIAEVGRRGAGALDGIAVDVVVIAGDRGAGLDIHHIAHRAQMVRAVIQTGAGCWAEFPFRIIAAADRVGCGPALAQPVAAPEVTGLGRRAIGADDRHPPAEAVIAELIADARLCLQVDLQQPVFSIPEIGTHAVVGDVAVGVIAIGLGVGGDNLVEIINREVRRCRRRRRGERGEIVGGIISVAVLRAVRGPGKFQPIIIIVAVIPRFDRP